MICMHIGHNVSLSTTLASASSGGYGGAGREGSREGSAVASGKDSPFKEGTSASIEISPIFSSLCLARTEIFWRWRECEDVNRRRWGVNWVVGGVSEQKKAGMETSVSVLGESGF